MNLNLYFRHERLSAYITPFSASENEAGLSPLSDPLLFEAVNDESEQETVEETEDKSDESEPEPVIEKIKEKLAPKDRKYIKKEYFSRIKNFSCAIRGIFFVFCFIYSKIY